MRTLSLFLPRMYCCSCSWICTGQIFHFLIFYLCVLKPVLILACHSVYSEVRGQLWSWLSLSAFWDHQACRRSTPTYWLILLAFIFLFCLKPGSWGFGRVCADSSPAYEWDPEDGHRVPSGYPFLAIVCQLLLHCLQRFSCFLVKVIPKYSIF